MLVINRSLLNADKDDDNYDVLVERQGKTEKNYDTLRNYNSIQRWSVLVVQGEDGGLWTHKTIIDKDAYNHNDQSGRVWVTKTGWLITKNSKHEGNTHHNWVVPEGPAIPEQKTDTLEDIVRYFDQQLQHNTTPMHKPVITDKHKHLLKLLHNLTIPQEQKITIHGYQSKQSCSD